MRLESRVLTVCLPEQARRMHGCRAHGSHFFMFIPKTGNPNCQPPWPRPPGYPHSVFHRSDRDI